MNYESPLFQFSLELFGHAIEHFNSGTNKDRKFVILHLANSVELILKDYLLKTGETIYKNPKETLSVSSILKKLTCENEKLIPNYNKLEMLIDERNSIQHRYGFPNELTTIFYMEEIYLFFKDFLKLNYNLEVDILLNEHISQYDLELFKLRQVREGNELDKLLAFSKVHPTGSILSAYAYLEKELIEIRKLAENYSKAFDDESNLKFIKINLPNPIYLPKLFEEYKINLTQNNVKKLHNLIHMKNQTSYGLYEPKPEEAVEFIEFIKILKNKLIDLSIEVEKHPGKFIERLIFEEE